jgi:RHS repeat-associated protein
VRLHLDDAGVPFSATGQSYTPFGVPQSGAAPQPFGFTGELHSNDLVYLRARWYDAANGTFTSVDPFDGFERKPYSLHPYQYGYSAPTMWTDPSGLCTAGPCGPDDPRLNPDEQPERECIGPNGARIPCPERTTQIDKIRPLFAELFAAPPDQLVDECNLEVTDLNLIDVGYVVGGEIAFGLVFIHAALGKEDVWNLMTFEYARFNVDTVGWNPFPAYGEVEGYIGGFSGWSEMVPARWRIREYGGTSEGVDGGYELMGLSYWESKQNPLNGFTFDYTLGATYPPSPVTFRQNTHITAIIQEDSIVQWRSGPDGWPTKDDGLQLLNAIKARYTAHEDARYYDPLITQAIHHNAEQWQRYHDSQQDS